MDKKVDIQDLSVEELANYFSSLGEKPYRTKQILSWIYHRNIPGFEEMTDISLDLREKLRGKFTIKRLELLQKKISKLDRTQKFLFQVTDGNLVETVLISNLNRLTACLSTQVGCKFRCGFCASGKKGFIRNLEPSEIINQLQFLIHDIYPQKISNVVFMGMGEPLDNYTNLLKAIRITNCPFAFNIGARKITVSTCGLPEGIRKLAKENIQVELSVSLHAPTDELRSRLMPVNKIHPLKELIPVCQEYSTTTNRLVTFEYLLIKDINDRPADIKELLKLLKDFKCKINLIIYNPFEGIKFCPSPIEKAILFQKSLKTRGIVTTLRQSKGADIEAACGQLYLRKLSEDISYGAIY